MTTRLPSRPGARVGYRLLAVLAGAMMAVCASASSVWAYATPAVVLTFHGPVRVTSADSHPVSGTFFFTPKSAATQLPPSPQTSPSATPNQTGGVRMPGWLKVAIGVVAIIFGITVARRGSGRGNAGSPP